MASEKRRTVFRCFFGLGQFLFLSFSWFGLANSIGVSLVICLCLMFGLGWSLGFGLVLVQILVWALVLLMSVPT